MTTNHHTYCLKITRQDDEVFTFTSLNKRFVLPLDGLTYIPGFRPFAYKSGSQMNPGNTDLEAGFGAARVTAADIAAGKWDNFAYEYFRVKDYEDLAQGIEKISAGTGGQITRGRTGFTVEIQGKSAHLNQIIGRLISPACDAELGDARCKVRLNPSAWTALTAVTARPTSDAGLGSIVKPSTFNNRHFECSTAGTTGAAEPSWNLTIGGTTNDGSAVWTTRQALTVISSVTSVASRIAFYDGARTEAADFFGGGKVTFTSGANDGLSFEVKEFPGGSPTGLIVLQLPTPEAIAPGDGFTMTAGCRYRLSDCITKFRNVYNFRGFPHLPGTDYLMTGELAE